MMYTERQGEGGRERNRWSVIGQWGVEDCGLDLLGSDAITRFEICEIGSAARPYLVRVQAGVPSFTQVASPSLPGGSQNL